MLFKKQFFCLLLFIFSFRVEAQTAKQIILKYIEFSGGDVAWKKIKTMVISGKYNYGGMEFLFTSWSKAPDLYKYEASLNGISYVQSYNGKKGWKMDGFNKDTILTVLTGKEAVAMANEADVELENPFINYGKKENKIALEGTDTIENTVCHKIKLVRKNNDTETYFFNTANFELVMKRAVSKNPEMKNSLIDIFYSDYHLINDVKIPFKTISKINEQVILTSAIEKVEMNVPLKDDIFSQ